MTLSLLSVVSYKIKWPEDDIWTEKSLGPGESYPHKLIFNPKSQIVPKIQYIPTQQNPQELVNTDTTEHVLNTKSQFFVFDVNDRIKPELDGYSHRFVFNPQAKKIELHAPKQTGWIANDTIASLSYTIKWSAGRLAEENYILEPGKVQPHWNTKNSTELSADYPKIRIESSWKNPVDDVTYDMTITKTNINSTRTSTFSC